MLAGHRPWLEGGNRLGRYVELQVLLQGFDRAEVLRFQALDLGLSPTPELNVHKTGMLASITNMRAIRLFGLDWTFETSFR
jgi:hypothetical protein